MRTKEAVLEEAIHHFSADFGAASRLQGVTIVSVRCSLSIKLKPCKMKTCCRSSQKRVNAITAGQLGLVSTNDESYAGCSSLDSKGCINDRKSLMGMN